MFLTVTLNPAVDKTLRVPHNAPDVTLRATEVIDLAGGKGINVARALRALGASTRNFVPLAGMAGAYLQELAAREGLEMVSIPVADGQTRTALTIHDAESGRYWHYLEPGPELTERDLDALKKGFVPALRGCRTVTISGSLPSASAAPLVAWMVRAAQERGLAVALDSFGASVRPALELGPWLAKPNVEELEATLGEALDTEARRWTALERLVGWGTRLAVLSMGADGALALAEGDRYRVLPPSVTEINDLGGGDSMLAGLCWAASQGLPARECLAWGAACGAANAEVWDPAGITRARVEQLLPQVQVVPLGSRG